MPSFDRPGPVGRTSPSKARVVGAGSLFGQPEPVSPGMARELSDSFPKAPARHQAIYCITSKVI